MDFDLQIYEQLGSTNEPVKTALEAGRPEGLVVRARRQTGGYGRQGRTWVSPPGGLYQSILLRPDVPAIQLPTLGLVVALSIRGALLAACSCDPADLLVKWPNDVMYGDGKLVGISCEAHAGGVCVGMGVNVMRPSGEVVVGGKNVPAYVCDFAEDAMHLGPSQEGMGFIDSLGDAILGQLPDCYLRWQRVGFEGFAAEYAQASYLQGREVQLVLADGRPLARGRVAGVDAGGSILIEDGSGTRPYSSGEAHVRRP